MERFFVYRVLHVDDTPHRIALGVAIGIFVAWTPTVGFQMILTLLLAALLRANKLVGVPFVWVSNPFTLGIIYYPNYLLGKFILQGDYPEPRFLNPAMVSAPWWQKIQIWWQDTWNVFAPLWLGSLVVGLFLGIVTYLVLYRVIVFYRSNQLFHHRRHLLQRKKNRLQQDEETAPDSEYEEEPKRE
jgi:hypothetical protein